VSINTLPTTDTKQFASFRAVTIKQFLSEYLLSKVPNTTAMSETCSVFGYWHCSQGMWCRICETVEHPSVHLSAPSIDSNSGRLAAECPMDRKYQSTAATAPQHRKQQQMSNLFTKLVCKKKNKWEFRSNL